MDGFDHHCDHAAGDDAGRRCRRRESDDERYMHLHGKMLRLPLVGREIPVVADDWAKPEFGTGAVKVTPAHDPNDFAIGQRHNLPPSP